MAAILLLLAGCDSAPGKEADSAASSVPTPPSVASAAPGVSPTRHLRPRECADIGDDHAQVHLMDGDSPQLSQAFFGEKVYARAYGEKDGACTREIVIRFKGPRPAPESAMPGIDAHYIKPPILLNPSDKKIKVDGGAFLQITFGAWMNAPGGGEGPKHVDGQGSIAEIVQTQQSEGKTTWVAGVDEERPIKFTESIGTPDCPDLCYRVILGGEGA